MNTNDWDVIVVGAGAAGLLAAARAAERGRRTLLLEKNRKPGVKILMSGGTRCNLTQATDARGIIAAYGRQGRFLHSALAAFSPQDLIALVEAEGVATKVEPTGKVFPVSNRAADVLGALRRRFDRSGAVLALGEPLQELVKTSAGFELVTPQRRLSAPRVIVTSGGTSYPGCGTTGDGYAWLAALGHTIIPPRPALVPITSHVAWLAELQGVTVPDVAVQAIEPAEKDVQRDGANVGEQPIASMPPKPNVLDARRGSLLFTHFGLSGPVVLDVSRVVSGHPRPQSLMLVCDFAPDEKLKALDRRLQQEAAAAGKKHVAALLSSMVPQRLADQLVTLADIPPERRAAELSRAERGRLVEAIKRLPIAISGTRGFKKAEVTAGGVALEEMDSHTMQSKRVAGLYVAGEVLDLDGPIGGYNFQAAFSTGWLAGENV